MRKQRTVFIAIVAGVVLVLLVIGGTVSAMALTHSGFLGNSTYRGMMGTQPGSPGMMGCYQQTPIQQGTSNQAVAQVIMHDSAYQPATLQVREGTTITWTNQDTVSHSVMFTSGMMGSGMMRSGMLAHGQTLSFTFMYPGTYHYACTVHPSMVGTVTVVS